jgi:hypothetical protein
MSTETVVIDTSKEAPNPSLEETAKEMGIDVDNIDETSFDQPADARPDWLPEKFKSAQDMAAAYSELEKKLGKGEHKSDTSDDVVDDDDVSDEDPVTKEVAETGIPEDSARSVVENAGLNFDEMSDRFWNNDQQISAEDYEALAKAGIPKHLVDQFAEGQKAVIQMERQEAFTLVGGEQNYSEMIQWASKNLTETEIAAYDRAVNSNDKGSRDMAIKGLAARYSGKVGFEPSREIAGTGSRGSADVYESIAQLQEDMSNPKYKTDSAFRRRVEQKLGRSDIF